MKDKVVTTTVDVTMHSIDLAISIMPILAINELFKSILQMYTGKMSDPKSYLVYSIVCLILVVVYKLSRGASGKMLIVED